MPHRISTLVAALCTAAVLAACTEPPDRYGAVAMAWTPATGIGSALPEGLRLVEGVNHELPLRAWAVIVDPNAPGIGVGVAVPSDGDGRATPTDLAEATGACVLINGGFYWIDERDRARHIGLLVDDGIQIEPSLDGVLWEQVRYPTARATVGADSSGNPVIRWVNSVDDTVRSWTAPFPNRLDRPADPPDPQGSAVWSPVWALSAGPALVTDGRPDVTLEEEAFFDAHIPRMHPRSAAGVTADGRLVLVVVDGRQPQSRGVYLEELAVVLRDLGARWALNLDGGGSSALVVNGHLVNRPAGTDHEREIASALIVTCP